MSHNHRSHSPASFEYLSVEHPDFPRFYSPGTPPMIHTTAMPRYWTADQWAGQTSEGARQRATADLGVPPPSHYDSPSYTARPTIESQEVVWIHQNSILSQQEPTPMSSMLQPYYVRVDNPVGRIRHRPRPYPMQPDLRYPSGSSTHVARDVRPHSQPEIPSFRLVSEHAQHQSLRETRSSQTRSVSGPGIQHTGFSDHREEESTALRRQRAHLDSERKRRE
jgi:hypothetical protein